jgi:hypothetical protein
LAASVADSIIVWMVGDAPLTEKIATFNAVLDFSCADAALLEYAAIAAAIPTNAIVRLPVTLISSSLFGLLQQKHIVIMAHALSAGPKPQGRTQTAGRFLSRDVRRMNRFLPLGRSLANAAISCSGRLVGAARLVNEIENIIVVQNR